MNILKKFKAWRDRKFRDRIDRVYFHTDENGVKELRGNLWVAGNVAVFGFCASLGSRDMLENATLPIVTVNPLRTGTSPSDNPGDKYQAEDDLSLTEGHPV